MIQFKSRREKGIDPLQQNLWPNAFGSPPKAQSPFRVGLKWLSVLPILLANALTPSTAWLIADDRTLVIHDLQISVIDQVKVPALETGRLVELLVAEGDSVSQGDLLARLDDEQTRIALSLAQNQLEIAVARAENFVAKEIGEKELQRQVQLATQHDWQREMAQRKSENEVRVLASQKAEAVAKNELARATQARQSYADSVSASEIDALTLAYERTQLETRQAQFDREMDRLQAHSEESGAAIHELNVQRSELELTRSVGDQMIATLEVTSRRHEASLADLVARRHRITAPWNGVVVEIHRHVGEWVPLGEPVLRMIRLDRLRAEGFVSAQYLALLQNTKEVSLSIHVSGRDDIERPGVIVFVSPEIDAVNDEVRFWVELDNPDHAVLPGMRLSLTLRDPDE